MFWSSLGIQVMFPRKMEKRGRAAETSRNEDANVTHVRQQVMAYLSLRPRDSSHTFCPQCGVAFALLD